MTSKSVRFATAADVAKHYSGPQSKTIRAVVMEVDGEILAIGGVAYMPTYNYAFMEMSERASDYPVLLMKATRKVVREIYEKVRHPLIADRDTDIESSGRFLERIGFVQLRDDLYIWKGVA